MTPPAVRFLTYGGNHTDSVGMWYEHDNGRTETVVSADWDADSCTTRVGLAPGLHDITEAAT